MDYKIITEGQTKLKIPDSPGLSSSEEVFYNPHMSLSRDFTVGLTRVCKSESFADVLAATGARGVRVANECDLPVSMNDLNPYAVKLMRENAKLNGIDAEIKSVDAKKFLSENRFDYVDLDPFGTPCNLVDMAFDAVKFGGIMGVCATDTSALCGSHPKACIRKYGASPYRSDFYDEAGLRLLIAFCAKNALKH